MNPVWIQQLWTQIRQEWNALPEAGKPWGVWITLHAPLVAAADDPLQLASVQQAWFLAEGMERPHERGIWTFARFWVMHFERSWDVAGGASPDPRFSARLRPIGLAAFAPYADSQDLYLETIWGGLWGWGRRLTLTSDGLIERTQFLWIA
jgi:hypothetical protein